MEKKQKKSKVDIILRIIRLISLAVFLFAAAQLLIYYFNYKKEKNLDQTISNITKNAVFTESTAKAETKNDPNETNEEQGQKEQIGLTDEMRLELRHINADYVAWIEIPDTSISYPVVKKDNEYYLKHNFELARNSHGAIFIDENCDEQSDLLLIHGHHMKDGTMFGGLKEFKKKEFREQHKYIYFDYKEKCEKYKIFAMALVDYTRENEGKEVFHYEIIPEGQDELTEYFKKLKNTAFYFDDYDQLQDDIGDKEKEDLEKPEFLVLSTCDYGSSDERFILVAKIEK